VTRGSDVDIDRLADYVGGALDGTPDAADVQQLVDTDPNWAAAYAALVTADAAVRADLATLRDDASPVPVDVAARLEAALAAASPPTRGNVTSLHRAPRKRRRWAVAVAAAAAVVFCAVGGIATVRTLQIVGGSGTTTSARDAGGGAAQTAPRLPGTESNGSLGAGVAGAPVIASGNDYRAETLDQVTRQSRAGAAPNAADNSKDAASGAGTQVAPPELGRLTDPAARTSCLAAIIREYGGQLELVDYARYNGSPALVVVIDGAPAAAGRRWVVVVGPTCGVGNAINDERYHTAV
jgi:hypothetical protein